MSRALSNRLSQDSGLESLPDPDPNQMQLPFIADVDIQNEKDMSGASYKINYYPEEFFSEKMHEDSRFADIVSEYLNNKIDADPIRYLLFADKHLKRYPMIFNVFHANAIHNALPSFRDYRDIIWICKVGTDLIGADKVKEMIDNNLASRLAVGGIDNISIISQLTEE